MSETILEDAEVLKYLKKNGESVKYIEKNLEKLSNKYENKLISFLLSFWHISCSKPIPQSASLVFTFLYQPIHMLIYYLHTMSYNSLDSCIKHSISMV